MAVAKKKALKLAVKEVSSPSQLCLYDEELYEESILFFKKLESFPRSVQLRIIVDLSGLTYISAAAVTTLFNIIASKQLEVNPSHMIVKLPNDKNTKALLRIAGFVKAIKQGGKSKLESLWQTSNFVCGNHTDVNRFLEKVRTLSNRNSLPNKLGVAMRESLLNVNHHAYMTLNEKPEVTWWSYIYVGDDDNQKGQYLATVITDRGIGIPSTIRPVIFNGLKQLTRDGSYVVPDKECILQAMKEKVTCTLELGRGKGSIDMKKPVHIKSDLGQHRLLILSGKGRYSYEVDETGKVIENTTNMADYYSGTLVEWFLYFGEA